MKHQIATDPSQSKRMLACGVDPTTADMSHEPYGMPQELTLAVGSPFFVGAIPAWSLSALLALLPSEIKEDNGYFNEISSYGLLIYPYMQGWQIDYQYCEDDECHCLKCIHDFDLIGACVKAIEWLTANGYPLNTK